MALPLAWVIFLSQMSHHAALALAFGNNLLLEIVGVFRQISDRIQRGDKTNLPAIVYACCVDIDSQAVSFLTIFASTRNSCLNILLATKQHSG